MEGLKVRTMSTSMRGPNSFWEPPCCRVIGQGQSSYGFDVELGWYLVLA